MSNAKPEGWYVYQARGSVEADDYGSRLWGVGSEHPDTQIVGLTRAEAQLVADALNAHRIGLYILGEGDKP